MPELLFGPSIDFSVLQKQEGKVTATAMRLLPILFDHDFNKIGHAVPFTGGYNRRWGTITMMKNKKKMIAILEEINTSTQQQPQYFEKV